MIPTYKYYPKETIIDILRKKLYETKIMFHQKRSSRDSDDLVELQKESKDEFRLYYLEYRQSRRQVLYGEFDTRNIDNGRELEVKQGQTLVNLAVELDILYDD